MWGIRIFFGPALEAFTKTVDGPRRTPLSGSGTADASEVLHREAVGLHFLSSLPLKDQVMVYPAGRYEEFLPGILPTSPYLRSVSLHGQFNAENGGFPQ